MHRWLQVYTGYKGGPPLVDAWSILEAAGVNVKPTVASYLKECQQQAREEEERCCIS